ncbi:MAG: hypothetical protein HXS54_06200 [Theionarchaea archaeon]|nr:hypothetical protein [Theionarchaea archaeon]DBA34850.1 TPA_asm: hypothetical protein vir521_00056 [Caudoviricetes sp. vir521]
MRIIPVLIGILLLLFVPSVSGFIYPQRDVYLSHPLLGETFTICNGQVFHFPFFRLAVRYQPGDRGGYGIHFASLTEIRTEILYCQDGTQCGIIEKSVTYGAARVMQGSMITVKDSTNNIIYVLVVEEEAVGWITVRVSDMYISQG